MWQVSSFHYCDQCVDLVDKQCSHHVLDSYEIQTKHALWGDPAMWDQMKSPFVHMRDHLRGAAIVRLNTTNPTSSTLCPDNITSYIQSVLEEIQGDTQVVCIPLPVLGEHKALASEWDVHQHLFSAMSQVKNKNMDTVHIHFVHPKAPTPKEIPSSNTNNANKKKYLLRRTLHMDDSLSLLCQSPEPSSHLYWIQMFMMNTTHKAILVDENGGPYIVSTFVKTGSEYLLRTTSLKSTPSTFGCKRCRNSPNGCLGCNVCVFWFTCMHNKVKNLDCSPRKGRMLWLRNKPPQMIQWRSQVF